MIVFELGSECLDVHVWIEGCEIIYWVLAQCLFDWMFVCIASLCEHNKKWLLILFSSQNDSSVLF